MLSRNVSVPKITFKFRRNGLNKFRDKETEGMALTQAKASASVDTQLPNGEPLEMSINENSSALFQAISSASVDNH